MILELLYKGIATINDKAPNIHYGGCCKFSTKLYDTLVELGYKPKLICSTTTYNEVDYWNSHFSGDVDIDIHHIFIELNGYYIDNNGVYKDIIDILNHDIDGSYDWLYIDIEVARRWNEVIMWNVRFDPKNITKVNKRITDCGEWIKDYKKHYKKFR